MLPQFKIISLIIRVFIRPILESKTEAQIQKAQASGSHRMQYFLIYLGNQYNKMDQIIDRQYLEIQNDKEFILFKKINDEKAIELGTKLTIEIIIYSIIIGLSSWELYSNFQESRLRQIRIDQEIQDCQQQLSEIKNKVLKDQAKLTILQQTYLQALNNSN